MKSTLFLFLVLLAFACDTPATLDFDNYEPQIAVNCLFTHGQYFKVNISKTVVITENVDWPIVENAEVTIKSIKKNIIHSIPYQEDGNYYDSLFTPEFDEAYQLTVNVPGYKAITAIDSLPQSPIVSDIFLKRTDIIPNEYSEVYNVVMVTIKIDDPGNVVNFYELFASGYMYYNEQHIGQELVSDDPIIINEKVNEYYSGTLIFSDELFNEQKVSILCKQYSFMPFELGWSTRITVISLSEKLYEFRKMIRRHMASSYDIVFPVEPVIMSSGIDNGYGIFAGYMAEEHYVYPSN